MAQGKGGVTLFLTLHLCGPGERWCHPVPHTSCPGERWCHPHTFVAQGKGGVTLSLTPLWPMGKVVSPCSSRLFPRGKVMSPFPSHLCGPGEKASEAFPWGCFKVEPYSDLTIGILVTAPPDAWRYRVSARTGRPGVCILSLGEIVGLICSFHHRGPPRWPSG